MCTSSETIVTTSSSTADRPSTMVPTVTSSLVPSCESSQVTLRITGGVACSASPFPSPWLAASCAEAVCSVLAAAVSGGWFTRWIQPMPTPRARMKGMPRAAMPISEPPRGSRFPKNRISRNDSAGTAGISQAWVSMSTPHQVDLFEVDRAPGAVDDEDDREADADFGGRDGDDEQGEDLPADRVVHGGERDQVDVDRVEDELDRHEHGHAVAAGEHPVDADREEDGREEQELVQQHPLLLPCDHDGPDQGGGQEH